MDQPAPATAPLPVTAPLPAATLRRPGAMPGVPGAGTVCYRGVRYARAVRFGAPEPVPFPGDGEADGTVHGPVCPQPPSRLRNAMGEFSRTQDEDCLSLTVTVPDGAAEGLPVVVFLHGGAYLSGGGSLDWYGGAALARGGMVVVGVNYRLGPFGFLQHPALGAETELSPGLMDIVAALRWVAAHVAAFGGDPGRVTLMGQSAGAHAIQCLLTVPDTAGLFARAVLLSPPTSLAPMSAGAAHDRAERLAALLGIEPGAADWAERLRAVPARELATAQLTLARSLAVFGDVTPAFLPVLDGLASPERFMAASVSGAVSRQVPVVTGTTREEMLAFFVPDPAMAGLDMATAHARADEMAGHPGALEPYVVRRPGGSALDTLADYATDRRFLRPTLAWASALAEAGGDAWVYQFDWAPPGSRYRACHCIDLPFVFGTVGEPGVWDGAAMLDGHDAGQAAAVSASVRAALGAFARTGDPALRDLPWPPYTSQARQTMLFGPITGAVGDPAGIAWRRHG